LSALPPPTTPASTRTPFQGPPPTPRPPRRALLDTKNHPDILHPRHHLKPKIFDFDEEDNRENPEPPEEKPPPKGEEEEDWDLPHLLQRLDNDIERLKEKVCQGLDFYKKRLGIRL